MVEDFLSAVGDAAQCTFATLLNLRLECRPCDQAPLDGDVRASVELRGGCAGRISLLFPDAVAQRLATILHNGAAPWEGDVADAVGELVNIIACRAKRLIPGGAARIGCPAVDRSPGQHASPSSDNRHALVCSCDCGEFEIELENVRLAQPAPGRATRVEERAAP